MFLLFFKGFSLGLGAAVPLGPINILIMNEAIRDYKRALAIGFGAMSADITYLLLIFYGLIQYLQNEVILKLISLLGGMFLLYLAYLTFQARDKKIEPLEYSQNRSLSSRYLKGYLLTLLNPYTILFWLSVTSYASNTQDISITLLGLISAILLWITIMPYWIYKKRGLISQKGSFFISLISSFILVVFGLSFVYNSLSDTFLN